MSLQFSPFEELSNRYDGFLIDQFGVLLSGNGPYQGAAAALSHIGKLGKPVVILSNSGKRSEANCARVVQNGFDRRDFLTVLTSGEVAHEHMKREVGRSIPKAGKVLILIREGDVGPVDDLGLVQTDDPSVADLLLIVSRDSDRDVSTYYETLGRLAARRVPCLCVNPDIKMLTPTGLMEAAGHLAKIYQDRGGKVHWFGKPHALIYERAKELIGPIAPELILCIGDSLSHDIKGGRNAGFKTALVRTGIHADLPDKELEAKIETSALRPDHIISAFRV